MEERPRVATGIRAECQVAQDIVLDFLNHGLLSIKSQTPTVY